MCEIAIDDDAELRLPREDDVDELFALIEAERHPLSQWLPWAAAQTHADTAEFITRARAQALSNDGFQALIVVAGEIGGVIGFHSVDWANRSTSIGYWLARPHQGRGMMTAAVRALTDHAISTWELNRVVIEAAVANPRSRAIPERLGYRQEGTLREAERVGDRQLDLALYAVLAADWR